LLAVLGAAEEVKVTPVPAVPIKPRKDLREVLALLAAVFTAAVEAAVLAESAAVDNRHQMAELVFPHQLPACLLRVAVAVAVVHITTTAFSVLAVMAAAEQDLEILEPQILVNQTLVVAVAERVA